MWKILLTVFIVGLSAVGKINPVEGQKGAMVTCGSTTPSKFTANKQVQVFALYIPVPGTRVAASIKPTGETLETYVVLKDSDGNEKSKSAVASYLTELEPAITSPVLSSDGSYSLEVYNGVSGSGNYRITVSCFGENGEEFRTDDSGKIVGDNASASASNNPTPVPSASNATLNTSEDFFGFRGLPQVTFDGISTPIEFSKLVTATLPANAKLGAYIGYAFDFQQSSDTIELRARRTAGNMNIGLALISADNKTYFFSTLIMGDEITARIKVDAPGEYTLGVFRIDLVPPKKQEKTVIVVQLTTKK